MIQIEVIILIIFIVIALIANHFLKKKRALRQAADEHELEIMELLREEQKAIAQNNRLSKSQEAKAFGPHVPTDSMLRRHYISHLRTLIVSLTEPMPTDSTLHRHYDTRIANELEKCLQDEKQAQQLIQNFAGLKASFPGQKVQRQPSIDAKPQINPAVHAAPVEYTAPAAEKKKKISCPIPQDSMLKRHFLNHLRSTIESQHSPRPSECVLRRHYDTMIDAELDRQIKEMST